ncbi:MAG: glycoside hydrolase family 9 protein [Gemmatimonadaceae bacterium]|nr:glycoside hydrolase family 9 protein [Gemmatimonadaceae bacterium]
MPRIAAIACCLLALPLFSEGAYAQPPLPVDSTAFIRINQVGYLPDAPKVAVLCALATIPAQDFAQRFHVVNARGRVVLGPTPAVRGGPFGPCVETWRLDFTPLRSEGQYQLRAGAFRSPIVRISAAAYRGLADTLTGYMRQQRSGYNPFLRDTAHARDGIIVDHPTRSGEFLPVGGGWADAADYLQYVTTSATATYHLLAAWRDAPRAFADHYSVRGLSGRNGVPDVLDEARHGLSWLLRMYPDDSTMFNQLGDDRDHTYFDLITTDSSDYGWGKGRERPVYPCTGKPQGIIKAKNRSTGYASTAGKMAAAFALGAQVFRARDRRFADSLQQKARAAYELGEKYPGVCQTAPGTSPYFYEEENWVDDMELGASLLHQLTGESRYLRDAMRYAAREPVTPWMGADTASHYQWYPFYNAGHFETWSRAGSTDRQTLTAYYRDGLVRVVARANNGFFLGIPFIWCSNDLVVSFANQAALYRRMTGDQQFREYEHAAIDWIFGTNPWGTSMVIGVPRAGVWPRDPHTELPPSLHHGLTGGLLDGPVYRSIYQNLRGIRLMHNDEFARFNTGAMVYHDDFGDYSTNEHIMDGTANLLYLLSTVQPPAVRR